VRHEGRSLFEKYAARERCHWRATFGGLDDQRAAGTCRRPSPTTPAPERIPPLSALRTKTIERFSSSTRERVQSRPPTENRSTLARAFVRPVPGLQLLPRSDSDPERQPEYRGPFSPLFPHFRARTAIAAPARARPRAMLANAAIAAGDPRCARPSQEV
jgi:hypothetical protein